MPEHIGVGLQPGHMRRRAMTKIAQLEKSIKKADRDRGPLIPLLQQTQAIYGWLPEEALRHISEALGMPLSKVYGVVTFYSQFYLEPRGRHCIKSCQGTACHVRGGKNVLQALEHHLEIQEGGTTKDMKFSLETVACLGTCFLAPVVMVDEDYYGDVAPKEVPKILKQYE